MKMMSFLGTLYNTIWNFMLGPHPDIRPWHLRWLATKDIHADLKRVLPHLGGRVLDIGCGDKPYKPWFGQAEEYIGIDIYDGPQVDQVVEPGTMLPFTHELFDTILCTQVFEHVAEIQRLLSEIYRILKPGGILVATIPFIYNEHGDPHDYWRFSVQGIQKMFEEQYEIKELKVEGGIGTILGALFLNWLLGRMMSKNKVLSLIKILLVPMWILFFLVVNGLCILLNKFDALTDLIAMPPYDKRQCFYHNVLLVARKPPHRRTL